MNRLRLIVVCFLALNVFLSCAPPGGSKTTTVKFEVTGTVAAADLVYQYGAGLGTPKGVSLPWSFSYEGSAYDWCDISAFPIPNTGYVTVNIYKNGSLWLSATNAPGGTYAGYTYAEVSGGL